MKKCIFLLFALFALTCTYSKDKEEFVESPFRYVVDDDTSVRIVGVENDSLIPYAFVDSVVTIPGTVVHNGCTYQIRAVGKMAFTLKSGIKHLFIEEGVETIDELAFCECADLETLRIPSTVDCIGDLAFAGCPNLRQIIVDERNEYYHSGNGGDVVVETESGTLVLGCYHSNIPDDVTNIGAYAFGGCIRLESMVVPEGVEEISERAFYLCPNLRTLSLPKSLKKIGCFAFAECTDLKSVLIPENVSEIEGCLFSGCYNLKEINVDRNNATYDSRKDCNAIIETATSRIVSGCGESVIVDGIREIGDEAFSNTALQRIFIPESVTDIGNMAFVDCKFCTSIVVDKGNLVYNSGESCNAIIETATGKLVQGCIRTTLRCEVNELGEGCFSRIPFSTVFVVPENIRKIARHAFHACTDLRKVILPESCIQIERDAFSDCIRLESVTLPNDLQQIDEEAFSGCPFDKRFKEMRSVEF